MSDSESTHAPRRSQRERKQVTHFTSGPSPHSFQYIFPHVQFPLVPGSSHTRKRYRADSNDGEDEHIEEHISDADDPPSLDENEQGDYGAQKPRGKLTGPPKKRGRPKAPKRTRVIKTGDLRETSVRKSKKSQANGDASNANKTPQDFKINTDNALFSACSLPFPFHLSYPSSC